MDTLMCREETAAAATARVAAGLLVLVSLAAGQTEVMRPEWRQIGDASVELMLASPAGGPVKAVWFSPDGSTLYVSTEAGRVFETANLQSWRPSTAVRAATPPYAGEAMRLPEADARLVVDPADDARVYALGSHLYRSEDGGRSWTDVTGYRDRSVIGDGATDLAISPQDPDQLVVANRFGLWRSMDGGLSWTGLNQSLPSLPVRKIIAVPNGSAGTRIWVDGVGPAEQEAGSSRQWFPVPDPAAERESEVLASYGRTLGVTVTAARGVGETVYAGTADGRIFLSTDGGRNWTLTSSPTLASSPPAGRVEAIWVDPDEPRVAVAALSGTGPRVLRTTNGGLFWDDLTANLPVAPAFSVTADRASGAVYVATASGLFFTRGDLMSPAPATSWTSLSANLPEAAARDVRLAAGGNQLYVALDGYGVFAAPAPHRPGRLQWVNAADFSTRAAAPGSLLSILGGRVVRAQAGDLNFPVLAASETESQVQVPYEAAGPRVSLNVDVGAGNSILALPIQNVSPAIFVDRDGAPMLMDADTGLMLNASNTARSGTRIQILAAGLGKVRPNWPTGLPAPLENPPQVLAPVKAFIDRAPVEVTRAVLAPGYVGFYLVELQLPAIVNAGPAELYLAADDQTSNRVRIYLEP